MADRITLVKGDTGPPMVITLTNEETEAPINLGGASVNLEFSELGSDTIRSTITGVITDPNAGEVTFYLTDDPDALSGEPGPYAGEIRINFPDGSRQTVYDVLNFWVRG
jgi:hypothetical protein